MGNIENNMTSWKVSLHGMYVLLSQTWVCSLCLKPLTSLMEGKGMQETENSVLSSSGSAAEFVTFPLENHLSTLGFTLLSCKMRF